jgi:hypothetical protein
MYQPTGAAPSKSVGSDLEGALDNIIRGFCNVSLSFFFTRDGFLYSNSAITSPAVFRKSLLRESAYFRFGT